MDFYCSLTWNSWKKQIHVTGKRFDHEKAQCQKTLKSTKKKRKEDEGSKCVKGTNIHLQVKGLSKYLIIKYYAILYRLNIIIFCVQSVFYNNVDIWIPSGIIVHGAGD